jgi:hypothetical protein
MESDALHKQVGAWTGVVNEALIQHLSLIPSIVGLTGQTQDTVWPPWDRLVMAEPMDPFL